MKRESMKPGTIISVSLRADRCAALLRLLEKSETIHPVEAELIANEIRLAVRKVEST